MDYKDIKIKVESDLKRDLAEGREAIRQLRFQAKGGSLKNVRGLRSARKMNAQIKTAISQKLAN